MKFTDSEYGEELKERRKSPLERRVHALEDDHVLMRKLTQDIKRDTKELTDFIETVRWVAKLGRGCALIVKWSLPIMAAIVSIWVTVRGGK